MRENLRFLSVGFSLLIAVGCSDSSVAPSAPARQLSAESPAFDFRAGGSFGDQTSSFVVNQNGGSFSVANLFNVNFPSNGICDPDLSSYGDGTWDSSCVTLRRAIRITATVRLTSGGLAVDFSPELRFAPDQQVTVSTDIFSSLIRSNRDYFSRHPEALRPLAMYYSATLGGQTVADYLSDPSLVTHINLTSGSIWRRVKHFSGYSLPGGQPCDPSPDQPDCVQVDQQ